MKALSVRQPWGYALMHLGKGIENRARKDGRMPVVCRHRGPLLIHASGEGSITGGGVRSYRWSVDWMAERRLWREPAPALIQFGGIIGCAVAIGHVDPDGRFWLDTKQTETDARIAATLDMRWHIPGSYGLVLADRAPLPFLPCRGALQLWEAPHEASVAAERALARRARRHRPARPLCSVPDSSVSTTSA